MRQYLDKWPIELSMSVEHKYGHRVLSTDYDHPRPLLNETRWQLDGAYYGLWSEVRGRLDLGYDFYVSQPILVTRELYMDIYPQLWWSLRAGRQALTWGKGDLLFINDLFPKDFVSFFVGRDIQYLKAPSDAIKLTLNPDWVQINVVYTPQFDPDRFPTGDRVTFYDIAFSQQIFQDHVLPVNDRTSWFGEDELAWRIQKNIKGVELALYGYHGYWKSPSGVDLDNAAFTHPSLNAYGMSVEGSVIGGILAGELGYYYSDEDRSGDNPLVRNSEWRLLLGYNKDFTGNWSIGLQYYTEWISQYDAYLSSSQDPLPRAQHTSTFRLRKLAYNQRIEYSLFVFYGMTNQDVYFRPRVAYKINDYWKIDIGGNIFAGNKPYTLWNNFSDNSNIYIGIKWAI